MEVKLASTVILCLVVLGLASAVLGAGCQISSDWVDLTMEERSLMSDTVVYGKTKEHQSKKMDLGHKTVFVINAVFDVYCVLKRKEDNVPETIVIEQIAPRDGCSGTKSHMQIGSEAIVSLKKSLYTGRYELHEVMPMLSATVEATKTNIFQISSICDMQQWETPKDATVNRCPICGVSNFTSAVMTHPGDALPPCFINGVLVGDGTNCNMFSQSAPTDTSTCVPTTFDRTCTRLAYQQPTATCQCETSNHIVQTDGFSEIDGAIATIPCLITIELGLVAFYFF